MGPVTKRSRVTLRHVLSASVIATVLLLALTATGAPPARADVAPPVVNATIAPGAFIDVGKTVDVPAVPPMLDLCLLVDLTGSYSDDLPNIRTLAPGIFNDVRAAVADSLFCVASFRDFPFSPWGSSGDFAYRLDQDLTASEATWTTAVNGLAAGGGNDGPEAQYEALFQMATGTGLDVPPAGASLGDVPAGQKPSFRATAAKVVAITTDAPFHTSGDSSCTAPSPPCPFGYPGASRDDTVAALTAASIKVIAIKAPGSGAEMDDLATATGGSVQTTGSTSLEIATAIVAGITNLPQDISAMPIGCDPLVITFVPPLIPGVVGPTTVSFTETIFVPGDAPQGSDVSCTVAFKGDSTVIARQQVSVHIPDVTAPTVACIETVNPHGGNVPPAGSTTLPGTSGGRNEDGFYQLLAADDLDPNPRIFVSDANGSGPFGPFASGDNVKITEAPGGTASSKDMGSSSGQAGAIAARSTAPPQRRARPRR